MAQMNGWTPLTAMQCQRSGARNADGLSSLVITDTVISVTLDQTEGTGATSATTRVRHGTKEGWGSMSG